MRLLVEAEANGRRGRIVPDDAVALVGDEERHADVFAARGRVIVPAVERVTAQVEEALLLSGRGRSSARLSGESKVAEM